MMAEENLFKEVEISGLLRGTRVFDITDVDVRADGLTPTARGADRNE